MQNYMVGALRGTALGKSKRAARMRAEGRRLPLMLPRDPRFVSTCNVIGEPDAFWSSRKTGRPAGALKVNEVCAPAASVAL